MIRLTIIIVIYGKECFDSRTLQSLKLCPLHQNITLFIFNNGPRLLSEDKCYELFDEQIKKNKINLILKQNINNIPLSVIYNDAIKENAASDYFMILDDDTEIPSSYFAFNANRFDFDLSVPLIKTGESEEFFYPIVDGIIPIKKQSVDDYEEIYTISSGLMISKSLTETFKCYFNDVFDTRFAFYGIDFNFFRRLRIIKHHGHYFRLFIAEPIRHSLSRFDGEQTEWRNIERIYDVVLSLKYYEKRNMVKVVKLARLVSSSLLKFKFRSIKAIFYSLLVGMHP
ncbi:TPA: glycosyltransferase family 2 protein, partial [Escherichia coli]|nr:glycosyltransferase family 2 protein [Escherichia coli]